MAKKIYEITLAFAGVCQAAQLVQQLARHGNCPQPALQKSLRSLTVQAASTPLALFDGHEQNLRLGLEAMLAVLNTPTKRDALADITRYSLSLINLERKLVKNSAAQAEFVSRLNQLDRQLQHFGLDSSPLTNAMAAIYVDIVSPLGPRIQVNGEQAILRNPVVQSQVRALLLSGVRAAQVWQQMGGGRLHLLFSRNKLVDMAKLILSGLPHSA